MLQHRSSNSATSLKGAKTLANVIKAYWAKRGFVVNTRVEPIGYNPDGARELYQVRSDMIAGLPRVLAADISLAA